MSKKHIVRAAWVYASIVAGIFLILVGFNWYLLKQNLVRQGFARPNFPYIKYSQEELNRLFPQYPLENVLTTQTPEETYAKFIAALKKGDVEATEKLFKVSSRERFYNALIVAKKENRLESVISTFSDSIIKSSSYGNYAEYKFLDGGVIMFEKEGDGVWRISII